MNPNVYIIAGPNGAGKTTFAREFLPNYAISRNFINADLIAQGVAPFSPESAAIRAGRLVLSEIANFARKRIDFGFETTLSGQTYLNIIRDLRNQGYQTHFFYLWLAHVEISILRIQQRVRRGGHNVPENDVRRRFKRSVKNFMESYRFIADSWLLFDGSTAPPEVIALENGGSLRIMNQDLYEKVLAYGKID